MDPELRSFIQQARAQGLDDTGIFAYVVNKQKQFMSKLPTGHPTAVIATNQALQNGADLSDLSFAKQKLGDQSYINYCQQFVENAVGKTGLYSNATEAWNKQQDKAVSGLDGISPGDAVYFGADDSNGGNGHTGIYSGNNRFISATGKGVQEYDLKDWQDATGQQPLGYIPGNQQGDNNGS